MLSISYPVRGIRAWFPVFVVLLFGLLVGCSRESYTELMNAAKDGNAVAAKQIIERGADVNASTNKGKRALMMAASEGRTEVARLLIERGAEVDVADAYGTTALIVAATAGHTEVSALLLEHGANPTVRDSSGGSPLVNATFFGHAATVKLLLSKYSQLEKQDGEELLLLAAGLGHVEIVDALIDHGVSVNGRGLKQRTALMAATAFNKMDVVRLLLARGADKYAADEDGNTALAVAKEKGNDEIAALLADAKP